MGVLFALIGPDGDSAFGLPGLLLQWTTQSLLPTALGVVCHISFHRSIFFDRLNPWIKLFASGSAAAVLFSPAAYGLDVFLDVETIWSGFPGLLDELGGVYFPVTLAWMAINAPFILGYQFSRSTARPETVPETPDQPAKDPEPRFMSLIPPPQQGDVVSLKAELHYLNVTTTEAETLILYNLRDAISELPDDAGIQTHRSYWAAFDAIERLSRTGRTGELKMKVGNPVPVSRARLKDVQEALNTRPSPDLAGSSPSPCSTTEKA